MSYNPGPPQDGWGNQPPQDGWSNQPPVQGYGYQQPGSSVPFGQQPGWGGPPQYPESSQSGVALGLGIGSLISFCMCLLLAPFLGGAAWYFGYQERSAIDQGRRDPSGRGTATTGMYLGIAGLAISAILIVGYIALIVLAESQDPQNF